MKAIKTERLLLRPFVVADAIDLFEMNNDPEVIRWSGDRAFANVKSAASFISSYDQYTSYKTGRLAMILKEDGRFTGWCGLKTNEDGLIDLGFRLYQKYWGLGYATEASMACIRYGFEEIHCSKIIGRTSIYNIAGQKVLEKCGFKLMRILDYEGIGPTRFYELTKSAFS